MSKVSQIKKELYQVETGYGLMSLTWKAVPTPKEEAFKSMKQVVEFAITEKRKAFFNVGEFYGPDRINLKYVRDFFAKYPELRQHVIISCKGGIDAATLVPAGKHDAVIASVENSVEAIGGYIDVFEVARIDLSLCKEGEVYPRESFEALVEMVKAGKIGGISLSEVNEQQIRAIAKDFPEYLTCVEVELSLFSEHILKDGVAKACSDLGLIIICYSPLGRGLLTGAVTSNKDIPEGDFRKTLKRFHGDAMKQNLVLVDFLRQEIVNKRPVGKELTLAQLALAWVKHWNGSQQFPGARFIPIPSGSTVSRVIENFDDKKTAITDAEFEKINDFLKDFQTQGDRYEQA